MKKLNIILLLLAVTFAVSAQPFQNIWYNAGNWPSADDPQEMSENPYAKKTVVAKKAGFEVIVDDLDEIALAELWETLGEEQFLSIVATTDGGDLYDLDADGTFGASYKVFWDDDFLYTVIQYRDANQAIVSGTQAVEIMFQTRENERYEAGFLAAADSTLKWRNTQYMSFVELGGGKALLGADGVTETVRNVGQTGQWGSSLGAGSLNVEYNWNLDADNTAWSILAMPFSDYLVYMVDEWGAYEEGNYESLDPTVKTKIAWDLKSMAQILVGEENLKTEYYWCSDGGAGWNGIYWNGFLEFSPEVIGGDPVGAQPFQNIWYNAGNWPSADDPQEMSENPFAKKTVVAKKAGFEVDIDDFDEIGIPDLLWDAIGDEQFLSVVATTDGGDLYDLDTDATFGASYKVFWDDDFLYTVLKYKDVNQAIVDGTQAVEIMFQTKENERYEAGFLAAADLAERNTQYMSFVELGGGKALLGADGVTETVRNVGQTGQWGSAVGAGSLNVEYNWNLDADNTAWSILAMPFSDYLIYMIDEWGAYEEANYESLDPTVKTKIAWDLKSMAQILVGEENLKTEYYWCSEGAGWNGIYWNGFLEFSSETFGLVSVPGLKADFDKLVYIYNDILRMKGFENPANVEIYSILGQKVMSAKNITTLNVSNLEKGIYFVKVEGEKQSFKVIK